MKIGVREIGRDFPPYVIAEMSGNHNGDLNQALSLVEVAAEAGADAVKLQTYTADTITLQSDKPEFRLTEGPWEGYTLYKLYDWAHTPWDWHPALFERARELNIDIFSSPFDFSAVDFLETLDVDVYKIASFELVDLPLIKKVALTDKPLILSTGMANLDEIKEALDVAGKFGRGGVTLLHCVSGYPTPVEQANLRTMQTMADALKVDVGLSDHTLGSATAVASVALGACIIEKHFTLSRDDGGPDCAFSLEPQELKNLCRDVKDAWASLGKAGFTIKNIEKQHIQLRRSLYVSRNIHKGEAFTVENMRSVRPGLGLAPKYYEEILGKKATQDIEAATPLRWSFIENNSSEVQ